MSRRISNVPIRVEGVCEGVYDQKGTMVPGLIWASAENSISVIETAMTNASAPAIDQPALSITGTNLATQGFYLTRGVVTFNDRVFENNFIFVQEDAAAVLVALDNRYFKNQLKVGQWVDLGGALEPGKYLPVITPLVVTELGRYFMPLPIAQPLGFPAPANRNGRWSEFEGVVHSVNSNDTLSVVGKEGSAYLWLGQTPAKSPDPFRGCKIARSGRAVAELAGCAGVACPVSQFRRCGRGGSGRSFWHTQAFHCRPPPGNHGILGAPPGAGDGRGHLPGCPFLFHSGCLGWHPGANVRSTDGESWRDDGGSGLSNAEPFRLHR